MLQIFFLPKITMIREITKNSTVKLNFFSFLFSFAIPVVFCKLHKRKEVNDVRPYVVII